MKFKSLSLLESPSKKRRREGNQESHNVDGRLLNTRIRDLRSKRVFSSKLIGRSPTKPGKRIKECNEGNEEKKDQLGENCNVKIAVASIELENRTDLNAGAGEEFENVVRIVNPVDSNSNFSVSDGHSGLSHIDQENNGSFGDSKRAAVLDEERLQKTPPDPEIVSLQELNGNGGRKLAGVMRSSDEEKPNGIDPNSKPRLMFKPCFKRKLFRAPGSFSYKRLLPYLVDIAGGSLEDDQCNKLDNGSEKSPTSNLDNVCKEYFHGGSGIGPQNLPSSTPESSHGINPKSEFLIPIDKKGSFKEPCSNPSIGSSSEDQKSSDAYHDRVSQGSEVSKNDLISQSAMEIDCPFRCEVQTMPNANSELTDNKNKLNIRNRIVRDPLAQLKLFGDPSSFSYKRLLPFITDLVEDNSKNHVPSGDNEFSKLEEGKSMEVHTRVEDSSCEKNCINELDICEFNVKQPTYDPDSYMPLSPTMCSTSGKASDVISEQVISDRLETESCNLEEQLDLGIDQNVRPESFHEERTKLLQDKSSGTDPNGLSPSKTPSLSLRKGILKKNPRGCRGICSCLSCSSFRLNAERAFEFSSNLMLDAEEVASELMKELSYTRTMLERAVDWIKDESGVHANQMKEACRKASEAETLAQGRLSQMNYELSIHSRIPCSDRPNVKFARNVEEKVIEDV